MIDKIALSPFGSEIVFKLSKKASNAAFIPLLTQLDALHRNFSRDQSDGFLSGLVGIRTQFSDEEEKGIFYVWTNSDTQALYFLM